MSQKLQPELSKEFICFLIQEGIKLEEYLFLCSLYYSYRLPLFKVQYSDTEDLRLACLRKNLITRSDDLTDRGIRIIGVEVVSDSWLEEWRNLFPKGYKQGSLPLRGDLKSIEKKMMRFLKTYPYSKEEIIEATRKYLKDQEKENYAYTKVAQYLIEKDGVSALAGLCEAFLEDPQTTTEDKWMKKA